MTVKAYQAMIVGASEEELGYLRFTHEVFNQHVKQMMEIMLQMRKGTRGADMQKVFGAISSNQNSVAKIEPLTKEGWLSHKTISDEEPEWRQICHRLSNSGQLLFDRHKEWGLPSEFFRKVCEMAYQIISGNHELMQQWRKERDAWVEERDRWLNDHSSFAAVLPRVREFDRECEEDRKRHQRAAGKQAIERKHKYKSGRGKRWSRWPLYLEWLEANPDLVAWRGRAGPGDFVPIPDEKRAAIKEAYKRQDKVVGALQRCLMDLNPELEALDSIRRFYVKNFRRFRRPPTLTYPSADKHPAWYQFKRSTTYKELDRDAGTVQLQVLTDGNPGDYQSQWLTYRFRSDQRLQDGYRAHQFQHSGDLPPIRNDELQGRGAPEPKLARRTREGKPRIAAISGAKLILKSKAPYLVFTVAEQERPLRVIPRKGREFEDAEGRQAEPRLLSVDLGLRHMGAFAIGDARRMQDGWEIDFETRGFLRGDFPGLREISTHRYVLRNKRRGKKAVSGERRFVELQDHITQSGEDRFKKGGRSIVEQARQSESDIIVMEDLERLMPTAENERWANRQLMAWNKRNIQGEVERMAPAYGILFHTVKPYLTSRLCSRCRRPGFRYSIKAKNPYREDGATSRAECTDYGYPVWDIGGHLFHCPHCGYDVNADINAAGNIALRYLRIFPDISSNDFRYSWTDDDTQHTFDARSAFTEFAVQHPATPGEAPIRPEETPF